ncbi:hypothetical protein AWB79_05176 [Caballeronia hypogeia]|uniref:Lipoprotein n=1 Tax=Caballeronia hypogeia TaxID=1777140 RepID=A0A158CDI1_9BURK|nr:hypothetical protein [Caballeronia hypogeia]SAK80359.1 hypothetical protein AWB79_05176 [Caballeronia hypogeia]
MRATLVLAVTSAVLAMSASVQAQDMKMAPAQADPTQQGAQGVATPNADTTSYGGAMPTTKASGASRDAWTGTSQLCTPGLSCNIYQGQ